MSRNTTEHLLKDMEQLRQRVGVERWVLRGGSLGVTLSLAYAQRNRERVSGMLMLSVTTTRRLEIRMAVPGRGPGLPRSLGPVPRLCRPERCLLARRPTLAADLGPACGVLAE